jgi:hypothetical protein
MRKTWIRIRSRIKRMSRIRIGMEKMPMYNTERNTCTQEEHVAMAQLTEEEFSKNVKRVEGLFATGGAKGVCRYRTRKILER